MELLEALAMVDWFARVRAQEPVLLEKTEQLSNPDSATGVNEKETKVPNTCPSEGEFKVMLAAETSVTRTNNQEKNFITSVSQRLLLFTKSAKPSSLFCK